MPTPEEYNLAIANALGDAARRLPPEKTLRSPYFRALYEKPSKYRDARDIPIPEAALIDIRGQKIPAKYLELMQRYGDTMPPLLEVKASREVYPGRYGSPRLDFIMPRKGVPFGSTASEVIMPDPTYLNPNLEDHFDETMAHQTTEPGHKYWRYQFYEPVGKFSMPGYYPIEAISDEFSGRLDDLTGGIEPEGEVRIKVGGHPLGDYDLGYEEFEPPGQGLLTRRLPDIEKHGQMLMLWTPRRELEMFNPKTGKGDYTIYQDFNKYFHEPSYEFKSGQLMRPLALFDRENLARTIARMHQVGLSNEEIDEVIAGLKHKEAGGVRMPYNLLGSKRDPFRKGYWPASNWKAPKSLAGLFLGAAAYPAASYAAQSQNPTASALGKGAVSLLNFAEQVDPATHVGRQGVKVGKGIHNAGAAVANALAPGWYEKNVTDRLVPLFQSAEDIDAKNSISKAYLAEAKRQWNAVKSLFDN